MENLYQELELENSVGFIKSLQLSNLMPVASFYNT